jgi:signal transduction histidine kinase
MQGRSFQSFGPGSLLRFLARALLFCRTHIFSAAPAAGSAQTLGLDLLRHELRTPVTGILGMCELLQKSELTGEQFQLASAMQESAKQLLRLISGIGSGFGSGFGSRFGAGFDIDRPGTVAGGQAGKQVLSGTILMEQVIRAHWPAAHRKGIGLFLHYDHRLPACWHADIVCLRQLLDNLLTNAIKFTHQGYVLVEVLQSRVNSSGRADVELKISDTGIGIAHRDARRIYSVREQGSGDIADRFGGSGLGLYVSSRMAAVLGGCITHESTGYGRTCFRVALPDLADPGTEDFGCLQPGLLKDLKCLLAMKPPLAAVLEQLLLRIGVQVTLNAEPRDSRIPAGADVVICEQVLLHVTKGHAEGTSGQSTLLLLSPAYAPDPATFDAMQGAAVTELPQPILRSNLEPLLLRVALQRKLQSGVPGN